MTPTSHTVESPGIPGRFTLGVGADLEYWGVPLKRIVELDWWEDTTVGALKITYHRAWPDWHIGPEQAVNANTRVQGKTMIPVHWGLFTLAMHSWTEPVERTTIAAQSQNVKLLTPEPGEGVEPTMPFANKRWWPTLPWETAAQHPIVSSQVPK